MEPGDKLAGELLETIIKYTQEQIKLQSDHRFISRDVFNALSRVTAGFIAIAVEPDNVARSTMIVLQHMVTQILYMIHDAVKTLQPLKQQFSQEDQLENLLNQPSKDDKQVS